MGLHKPTLRRAPPPLPPAVAAAVATWWLAQEWLVHGALLHSSWDWPGRAIHHGHHVAHYYHVSIDGPGLILPAMAASGALAWAALGATHMWLTAAIVYWCMGLLYEWTHFLVHTRYVPRSAAARSVRRHHMLHHCRNEAYWLAFIAPGVDALMGTAPRPGAVRISELARKGFRL